MIPAYQSLMRPVLKSAVSGPRKISDVVEEISDELGLTEEQRKQLLPSGKQTVVANRIHWARSYLKQAGLVQPLRRGWFELTERGRQALAQPNTSIDNSYLEQFAEFQEFRSRTKGEESPKSKSTRPETETSTPDEDLQSAHKRLENTLAATLLANARQTKPAFFEQLIVDLFLAMGYGGTFDGAGRALGQSGDNGVDGVIDQDPLGVDQIYLQAKRYQATNSVGPGEIRDFFGALSLKKASKGIFVTTSHFTDAAKQTARDLGSRIVLIDGLELSRLMIKYNVGCESTEVLHIKELDESYFDLD